MAIATSLKRVLTKAKVSYRIIRHEKTVTLEEVCELLNIPKHKFARAVIVESRNVRYMAILPVSHELDLNSLKRILKGDIKILRHTISDRVFFDCESLSHPPIPWAYKLTGLCDISLLKDIDYIYFEAGTHTSVIKIPYREFKYLLSNTLKCKIAKKIMQTEKVLWRDEQNYAEIISRHKPCINELYNKFSTTYTLPKLPNIAKQVLELSLNEDTALTEVLQIIEKDKNFLSAIPKDGPIGLTNFWRHALYTARAAKKLEPLLKNVKLNAEYAYLCGLMHNFGFLLMGHLFLPEFNMLNRLVAYNVKTDVIMLEQKIIGMGSAQSFVALGHTKFGEWLLRCWGLPEVCICVAKEHHNENYTGEFAPYVYLIQIISNALQKHCFIEHTNYHDLELKYKLLGISQEEIEMVIDSLIIKEENFAA